MLQYSPLRPGLAGWPELAQLLDRLVREEELAEFDRHWVELLARLDPDASPTLLLTAALLRAAVDQGHVCLELGEAVERWPAAATGAGYPPPEPQNLEGELRRWSLVDCREGDGDNGLDSGGAPPGESPDESPEEEDFVAPLVLAGQLLYLRRYRQYEQALAAEIRRRAVKVASRPQPENSAARLAELTVEAGVELDPDQRAAVLGALDHHLTVISGGPGTGKTTIIFFILALLTKSPFSSTPTTPTTPSGPAAMEAGTAGTGSVAGGCRVLLLAPTGKAAARLSETLRDRAGNFQAMTIHRALGYQVESPTIFRHNRENPLAADLVVVDEASMVDMALMSKLFAAVPPTARLVLLGDKDQLASVEAGSILGDICHAAPRLSVSIHGAPRLAAPRECLLHGESCDHLPLASSVIELNRGFRFDPQRGIGALVRGIKAGEPEAVLTVPARHPDHKAEVTLSDPDDPAAEGDLSELVLAGFRPCLEAASPAQALERLADFRLLCAHRRGPEGVEQLNRFCRDLLLAAGLLPRSATGPEDDQWYRGRPVLVVANSYEARLFNGDLGIIWNSPEDEDELMAFFPAANGPPRRLPPGRLPRHETAFAMTIHKSQGSEFDRVAVVLPRDDSPLLSRELLYTAVSRARSRVHLFGSKTVISQAVRRRVTRTSGLAGALAP